MKSTRYYDDHAEAQSSESLPVSCVWFVRKHTAPHIDHCFPWARRLNNDLWTLVAAGAAVNISVEGGSAVGGVGGAFS